jgi:YHS domain-containing protein
MTRTLLAASLLLSIAACDDKKGPPAPPAPPAQPAATAAATAPTATATATAATTAAAEAVTMPTGAANEPPAIPNGTKMKCPVSGEDFVVKPTTMQVIYAGKRYAFCCADCLPDFKKDPAKFAQK